MRRLALVPVLALLVAGCGWQGLLLQPLRPVTAQEALASEVKTQVPKWINDESLPPDAVSGAKLFAVAGCTACHTYMGRGSINLGAPDLTAIGLRRLGITFEIRHLRCPSCVNPGSAMPPYAQMGNKLLRELAIFLEASKGTR